MSEILELSKKLIAKQSITPDDAGCQDILINELLKLNFKVEKLPFGKVDNFYATLGEGINNICFAGHSDVVPAGNLNNWLTHPFSPTVKSGYLYGRGAADMKSALAAMIIAIKNFLSKNKKFNGKISMLITSDEEGEAKDGTQKVIQYLADKQELPTWCIVGEPSATHYAGDTIKNGRRGSLTANLVIYGKQGHVAYPDKAENAIHKSFGALEELSKTFWCNGNEFFPATTMQISNLSAGTGAANIIPGELQAQFNFRFSTEVTPNDIQTKVENIFAKHQIKYKIDWQLMGVPFLTANGKLIDSVKKAIEQITGKAPFICTTGGTSDGRFIAPFGVDVVEVGVSNESIHAVNEKVRISCLDNLVKIYEQCLNNLLI